MDAPYEIPDPFGLHLSPHRGSQSDWDNDPPKEGNFYSAFTPENLGGNWWQHLDITSSEGPAARTALNTVGPLQEPLQNGYVSDYTAVAQSFQNLDAPGIENAFLQNKDLFGTPQIQVQDNAVSPIVTLEERTDSELNMFESAAADISAGASGASGMDNVPLAIGNVGTSPTPAPSLPSDTLLFRSLSEVPADSPSVPHLFVAAEEGTHASRNPDKARQPLSRKRGKTTDFSEAEKASRALKQEDARAKRARLNDAVSNAKEEYEMKLAIVAKDHGRKVEYVQKLAKGVKSTAERATPSLWNALSAVKAEELNDDRHPDAPRASRQEIQEAVKADPRYRKATKEERDELKKDLLEKREIKAKGARVSHRSAALDVSKTSALVQKQLSNLSERTGVRAVAFIAPSHIDDTVSAQLITTGGGASFMPDVLSQDARDVARKFNQWSITAEKGEGFDTKGAIRGDVSLLVVKGLRLITKKSNANMNYINYICSIVLRFGVKIVGWIGDIQNPKEIDDEDLLRSLRERWRTGECRWENLTPEDRAVLLAKVQTGDVARKPRKVRADKGKKRGVGNEVDDVISTEERTRKVRSDKGKARNAITAAVSAPEST